MDVYQFMFESPILTVLLAVIISEMIVRLFLYLPNMILRHWNIRKHGYPPPHCDADGDFKNDPPKRTNQKRT